MIVIRYGYGYVYETDCMTGMVEDVIPTYDYGYGVGQLLPSSYGYYNVPYRVSQLLQSTMTTIITAMRRARSIRSTAERR